MIEILQKKIEEAMVNGDAELATKVIDLMSGCSDPFKLV